MGVKYQVESVLYENLRVESCVCLLTGTCQLNESWRGSWFQSGFDNIHINSTSIDVKGRCLESDRDYFLFEDRYFDSFHSETLVIPHVRWPTLETRIFSDPAIKGLAMVAIHQLQWTCSANPASAVVSRFFLCGAAARATPSSPRMRSLEQKGTIK